jgi:hypothetical protein
MKIFHGPFEIPRGFGVRQPPGAFRAIQSGSRGRVAKTEGLTQSKTLPRHSQPAP